ncbi:MAG: methylenetetrahydrofolate--tRNA-(uracil(54)-C(5))-methyltransferase (FADH(2)-oxidizing) TrmFO, partial [Acidobacteria bacterium]|nr:methylenetetrahydrofolate--tRNA-(uracil(54)-C(5))-methyltransferase (FADH(2)-oxidizing) TrmFO [Acidobacteriota bacterium]
VSADTVDRSVAFLAARYNKGGDDYLNCPFNDEEYQRFYDALVEAKSVPLHRFEETRWFEACLPIEEIARRGRDTLRFGPMKPVGLVDPRTGREPYAAVQLRQENLMADAYNLVGFQNHLRFGEQQRVLRLIPGLENVEFLQFGQIHRNTYIRAPRVLAGTMQMRERPSTFFAGQISGVEGYVESVATGWLAGINAAKLVIGQSLIEAPAKSAVGALARYVSSAETKNYQPVNITFALLEPLPEEERRRFRRKRERHQRQVELALKEWDTWLHTIGKVDARRSTTA